MKSKDYFFIVFLISIIVIRLFLYFYPIASPTINGFRTHHYMYGLVLIPLSVFVGSIALYAIGVSLFADEFYYILIGWPVGGNTNQDAYSKESLGLLIISMMVVYLLRGKLLFWQKLQKKSME